MAVDDRGAPGVRIAALGVLTGWGEGVAALPERADEAAGGRAVIALDRPPLAGDRFRRATRECLLGVAAVGALLRDGDLQREAVAGSGTALLYVTAAGYGAANRQFIEAASGAALHFPYTAPSAVPAEVAIEFGFTGPYHVLIGGADATVEALWQASVLLRQGACQRALVLTVETFAECADLYARGRWLLGSPLVEAAAAALLVPGDDVPVFGPALTASAIDAAARGRAGESLACGPLIALALARVEATGPVTVTGQWRGRRVAGAGLS